MMRSSRPSTRPTCTRASTARRGSGWSGPCSRPDGASPVAAMPSAGSSIKSSTPRTGPLLAGRHTAFPVAVADEVFLGGPDQPLADAFVHVGVVAAIPGFVHRQRERQPPLEIAVLDKVPPDRADPPLPLRLGDIVVLPAIERGVDLHAFEEQLDDLEEILVAGADPQLALDRGDFERAADQVERGKIFHGFANQSG